MITARGVFCPYCSSNEVEQYMIGEAEWVFNSEITSNKEVYECINCGRKFMIHATYLMAGYIVCDMDNNEIEEVRIE